MVTSPRHRTLQQALHLLALLTLDAWTVPEMAAATGLHRRSVYRYLHAFRDLGLPLLEEPAPHATSGYRLGGAKHWYVTWLRQQGINPAEHQRRRATRAHMRRRQAISH